jgi:fluoride exporter
VTWLAVAAGGALGSALRHLVSVIVHRATGSVGPYAVAAVNISGCLAIGVLAGTIASGRWSPSQTVRSFLIVGVLGGFTTFSSFGLDVLTLAREGRYLVAAINILGQVALGLGAVFLGYSLATR